MVTGNNYPCEEKKGSDINISGSGAFAFPSPSSSSTDALITLSPFPLVAGKPHEACFLVLLHLEERQGGPGSVVPKEVDIYSGDMFEKVMDFRVFRVTSQFKHFGSCK